MKTAREKLEATVKEMCGEPGEDAHPLELSFRSMLMLVRGRIGPALAEYEDELDEQLGKLAKWVLAHRSDNAPAVTIDSTPGELPAA